MKFNFYYINNEGKQIITGVRDCKKPARTKLYKELQKNFNCGFINAYGYEPVKQ